ncbi:hypothetical protein [Litoribacter populi]|uniref:hypothetical protein n=1 Tax=Litoribacter populi TaxID=2598460 RepID=UPI00117EE9F9|nr:hypothetical protein [Litoribacter populi]
MKTVIIRDMNKCFFWLVLGLVFPITSFAANSEMKLSLVLGKEVAIAGDYIPAAVFLQNDTRTNPSSIAYLEIFNEKGDAIVQQIIPLKNSTGEVLLNIPSQLSTGYYLVRGYTKSLLALNPNEVSYQWIAVVNPEKPSSVVSSSQEDNMELSESKKVAVSTPQISKREKLEFSSDLVDVKLVLARKLHRGIKMPSAYAEQTSLPPMEVFRSMDVFGHTLVVEGLNEGEKLYISTLGEDQRLFTVKGNDRKVASIELGNISNIESLVVQSAKGTDSKNFRIQSPFWRHKPSLADWPTLLIPESVVEDFKIDFLQREVNKFFHLPDTLVSGSHFEVFSPEKIYILDEYNRFENLATTIREYVTEVLIRNQNGSRGIKVINKNNGEAFEENPLILIDGVPVFNVDELLKWPARFIQRLEIIDRPYLLNGDVYAGVIQVITIEGNMANFPLPESSLVMSYPSMVDRVRFNSPDYFNSAQKRIPDFRSLLFWQLAGGEEGIGRNHLYASDYMGEYELLVYALDDDGKLSLFRSKFEIIE